LGYRILHGLSLYERFAVECIPGNNYEVRENHGELVNQWTMEPIAERFGPNLSCMRYITTYGIGFWTVKLQGGNHAKY
jgi:hypothetical protein